MRVSNLSIVRLTLRNSLVYISGRRFIELILFWLISSTKDPLLSKILGILSVYT